MYSYIYLTKETTTAKTLEELNQLKNECETLTSKLKDLSEDELEVVTGGGEFFDLLKKIGKNIQNKTKPILNSINTRNSDN